MVQEGETRTTATQHHATPCHTNHKRKGAGPESRRGGTASFFVRTFCVRVELGPSSMLYYSGSGQRKPHTDTLKWARPVIGSLIVSSITRTARLEYCFLMAFSSRQLFLILAAYGCPEATGGGKLTLPLVEPLLLSPVTNLYPP